MTLFDDTYKEWVKSTAKPRIPPPILRGNIFKLGSAEVELSRKPNSSAHHQLDSKTSDSKRPDPRRPEVSSPNAVNKKNAHPSIDRIQSNRPYTQLSSPAFPTPDSSDFAPDASDIASTYPTYASSALQENSQELVCASPTYVREPSPPATWASPTYSYQSPPYVQPLLEFVDETAPPSPTYAPRSVYLAQKADWSNYRKEVAEVVRDYKTKHVDCWTTEEGRIKQLLTAFPKDVLVLTFNRYSDEYPELAMNAEKILHDLRAGQVQELAAHFAGLGLANRRLIIDRSDHMEATEIFLELVNRFVICEGAFLRPLPPLNTGTSLQDWRKYKEDVIKICSDNKKFGFEEWQTDEGCLNQLLTSLPLPVREKVFDLFVKNTASSTEKSEILEDIRKNSFKKLSSFIARLKLTDILGDRSDAESAQFLHWQMQLIFRAAGAVKEWLLPKFTFKMTL